MVVDFEASVRRSYDYDSVGYKKALDKWGILKDLYLNNFVNAKRNGQRIPKKIHQVWLGGNLPEKYQRWMNSWKEFHPDWEYRLWTDDDIPEIHMTNPILYNTITNYGPKSDFLRYHILNQFGGIYVDTDFECLKPLDDLLFADFITGIGYPMTPELYVGFIASTPHHPITEQLVTEVSKGTRDVVLGDVLNIISSYFFTRNFFKVVGEGMPGVFALPTEYLYPFPNVKNYHELRSTDYIKPQSYAVHHWAISWAVRAGQTDWIQGDRFKWIVDYTYAPAERHRDDYDKLPNTFDPSQLKEVTLIYTHTFYVKQLFRILKHLKGKFVVITHNSDMNVDDSFETPDNVKKWFAQNVCTSQPKLQCLPIGLQNNRWDPGNRKKVAMNECLKRQRTYRNLVYLNCNVKTNQEKRSVLYGMFNNVSWITATSFSRDFSKYIRDVYNHKFVICPEGNGADTHRLWETLYMGSIPIVLRTAHTKHWEGMPVCFVNSWKDLTEEFLNSEWIRIRSYPWNFSRLNFEYWRSKIVEEVRKA